VLGQAMLSGYGREHELESDGLGAEYLARAGYDPQAILDVLRTLKAQGDYAAAQAKAEGRQPQAYHGLFASHPDEDTRLKEVLTKASFLAPDTPSDNGRDAFLRHIDGMVFGDSAAQGIRRGNRFYHRDLNFALEFPPGWRLENRPDRLLAIAPGGKAQAQLTSQDLNQRETPREFMIRRLGIKNPAGEEISPAGLPGYSAPLKIQGRPGRVSVIFHRNQAYVVASVALDGVRQPGGRRGHASDGAGLSPAAGRRESVGRAAAPAPETRRCRRQLHRPGQGLAPARRCPGAA